MASHGKLVGDLSRFNDRHPKKVRGRVMVAADNDAATMRALRNVISRDDLSASARQALNNAPDNGAMNNETMLALMENCKKAMKAVTDADEALIEVAEAWVKANPELPVVKTLEEAAVVKLALTEYRYTVEKDEDDRKVFEKRVMRHNTSYPDKKIVLEKREVGCCAIYRVPLSQFTAAGFDAHDTTHQFGGKDWWPIDSIQKDTGWANAHGPTIDDDDDDDND